MLVQFFCSKSVLLGLCVGVGSNPEAFPPCFGEAGNPSALLNCQENRTKEEPLYAYVLTVLPTHLNETAPIH